MCMRKKADRPNPIDIVKEAVMNMQEGVRWRPETFFAMAAVFAGKNKNGFNAKLAADEFIDQQRPDRSDPELQSPKHMISSVAVAFSMWVLITEPEVAKLRIENKLKEQTHQKLHYA